MRIIIPVIGEEVSPAFDDCEALKIYEDDHGRILREQIVPIEGSGFDAVCRAVERSGADVLVCGGLNAEERKILAMSGVLLSQGAAGSADEAARAYLGAAIACDPNNHCNYCGHKAECELNHEKRDG